MPTARWLVLVTVAGLAAVVTTLALTAGGGRHTAVPPRGPTRRAAPAPSPAAAPGTVLLTCDPAGQSQLASNWRAGSLEAGPLWFFEGRQQGYVHDGGWQGAARAMQRPGKFHLGVMIVMVMPGSTVVMKPAVAARSYFRFVDRFGPGVGYKLPASDTGFTFAACPRGLGGPYVQGTYYYLGFSMQAGRAAPVKVWPSARSRPIRVIFTCPGRGCEG